MNSPNDRRGFAADFHRIRADAIRKCVHDYGIEQGASASRIAEACREALERFERDPSSGHRAICHGQSIINRPANVVPFRRGDCHA